jgi:hypothetical protein
MSSTSPTSSTYITNKCYGDDFITQYKYLIDILLICYANGYEFVYNKLTHIENNYENDPHFVEDMENLMNLRPHFTPFGHESLNNAFITIYDNTVKNIINENIDYYASDTHMRKIKEMFWANKNRNNLFDNNGKSHVVLYLPENVSVFPHYIYINIIKQLRDQYHGNLIFHIYVNDSIHQFQSYIADDTLLHMNENIESTFISMVGADMLIMSNNLLSYTAALLSDGIIYNLSNDNPPRNTWISLSLYI